jgi:hypothetical protein
MGTLQLRKEEPIMKRFGSLLLAFSLTAPLAVLGGCDADQDLGEVETPSGEVEVERDADTGAIETEPD